jgi:multidrug efflux system outer membrane protein
MLNRKLILATVLSLGLTACSVGPRYKQPALALPQQFTAPDTATVNVSPMRTRAIRSSGIVSMTQN